MPGGGIQSRNDLIEALKQIEEFGYSNSGRGFTCARMASVALGRQPKAADKWEGRP